VQQDISILIARVGKEHQASRPITFGLCVDGGPLKPVAAAPLPLLPGDPWVTPSHVSGHAIGGATLEDYDAKVRSGYFVWNREQERMHTKRARKLDVPLIWAENISAGKFCLPKAKKRKGADYVRFESESQAIVRTNAIVIQRTTNNSQARRLIAGRVAPRILKKYGGFVSENHTIVITAPSTRTLITLTKLLNSAAVDARYRRLSGTASISVELLRQLDLPDPIELQKALAGTDDIEAAVEAAYAATAAKLAKAVA
jgi:adenine-specific DNA-methyltransferase